MPYGGGHLSIGVELQRRPRGGRLQDHRSPEVAALRGTRQYNSQLHTQCFLVLTVERLP